MYWITGILGIISVGSPFMFGYSHNAYALWTSLLMGVALIVLSGLEAYADDKQNWEYWVAGIIGVGAIAAPFALGYTAITAALWISVGIGIVAVLVAGSKLFSSGSSYS